MGTSKHPSGRVRSAEKVSYTGIKMIHKLQFTNVKTSANLVRVIVRCEKCSEAREFELKPNQFVLSQSKGTKGDKVQDKWYYSCKVKKRVGV